MWILAVTRAKDQRDDVEGVGIADGDDLVDHLETSFEVAGIDPLRGVSED